MKAFFLATFILVAFSAQCQLAQYTIHFNNDEDVLDDDDKVIIASLLDFVSDEHNQVLSIELFGYADTNASVQYNIDLSKRRATTVAQAIKKDLPAEFQSKLKVSWYGETKPEATKKNLNYSTRSVDVMIRYAEKKVENISHLIEQLYTPVQKFRIDPLRDTIVTGQNGTVVVFNANTFYIPKSCEGQLVEIFLQESYDPVSIFRNNLTTTSGNRQLESDGMIFINAQLCGRVLTLKEDAKVTILFPTEGIKEGMSLYAGDRDPNTSISWNVSTTPLRPLFAGDVDELLEKYNFYNRYLVDYCPLFFCKFREFFTFGKAEPVRKIQKYKFDYFAYQKYIDSMCAVYGVKDMYALSKVLKEQKERSFGNAISNGRVEEWSYYVSGLNNLGWLNCDRFSTTPPEQKVTVSVKEAPADNISVSLVFTSFKSMMNPNYYEKDQMQFQNIAKGEKCFVVALKYENKKPFMSIQKITVSENLVIKPEYKEYTVEEMKKELQNLGV